MTTQAQPPVSLGTQGSSRPATGATSTIDLDSVWYPPFQRQGLTAPFAQEYRLPSSRGQGEDASDSWVPPVVDRVDRTSQQGPAASRFQIVGRWRGWVTEVLDETFQAEVEDLRNNTVPHAAEFPLDLVSDFDRPLLAKNAIFYWTIGFRHRPTGTRLQETLIRFRRAPRREPWTDRQGTIWAQEVRSALHEDL